MSHCKRGNFNYATLCTHCTQLLELASWISKEVFKASRFIFGLSELLDFVCEFEDIVFVSILFSVSKASPASHSGCQCGGLVACTQWFVSNK